MLINLLDNPQISVSDQIKLCFTLGKINEDISDFKQSFYFEIW